MLSYPDWWNDGTSYKLVDEFDDNKYNGRSYAGKYPYAKLTWSDGSTGICADEPPNVENCYPNWEVMWGNPPVENGEVNTVGTSSEGRGIGVSSTVTVGTWEVRTRSPTDNGGAYRLNFIWQDADNRWVLYEYDRFYSDPYIRLSKRVGGEWTQVAVYQVTKDYDYHIFKVTRDSSGNFTVEMDGVQIITASDTWLPSNPNMIVLGYGTVTYGEYWDWIKVY